MEKLTVTLKTVTPLFLGGANPNESAELRASSIKGMMRFWYRAFDYADAEEENAIFGSADTGQGIFNVRVLEAPEKEKIIDTNDSRWQNTKIPYLGYGSFKGVKTVRKAIDIGASCKICIVFKPMKNNMSEDEKAIAIKCRKKAERSLWAMLMFGGLGARNRRGFGALAITAIEGASLPLPWNFANMGDYKTVLEGFIGELNGTSAADLPKHTSWSRGSNGSMCVVVGNGKNGNGDIIPFDNWEKALEEIGAKFHAYRSSQKSSGGEGLFVATDKKGIFDYLINGTKPSFPQRAAFGLPHNYFFTNSFKGLVCKNNIPPALLIKLNSMIVNDEGNHVRFKLTRKNYGENEDNFISRFKSNLDSNGITDFSEKNAITAIWQKSRKGVKGLVNYKDGDKDGRRASPLIIHIQEFLDNKACITVTFMPAKFLPDDKPYVEISGVWENVLRTHPTCAVAVSDDFSAVENFMTRLAQKGVEIK